MVEIGVLGVFAGIAVAMSFFLAYYLIAQVSKKNSAVVWLGLAVLAIGLRIAKSIIFFIFSLRFKTIQTILSFLTQFLNNPKFFV